MKSISGNFKECVIQYDKLQDNGLEKKVTEKYVVKADSFTEAESRIIGFMDDNVGEPVEVININPCVFREFIPSEGEELYFKVKIALVTLNEKTGKEKKSRVNYLVQADSFDDVKAIVKDLMSGVMLDYVVEEVKETSYVSVSVEG